MIHIPKGYTYFAMGFAFSVELLNLVRHRQKKPINSPPTHSKKHPPPPPTPPPNCAGNALARAPDHGHGSR